VDSSLQYQHRLSPHMGTLFKTTKGDQEKPQERGGLPIRNMLLFTVVGRRRSIIS